MATDAQRRHGIFRVYRYTVAIAVRKRSRNVRACWEKRIGVAHGFGEETAAERKFVLALAALLIASTALFAAPAYAAAED